MLLLPFFPASSANPSNSHNRALAHCFPAFLPCHSLTQAARKTTSWLSEDYLMGTPTTAEADEEHEGGSEPDVEEAEEEEEEEEEWE